MTNQNQQLMTPYPATSPRRASSTGRGFLPSVRAGFTLVELPVVSKRKRSVELPVVSGRERKAFTLVELLVVITIIGILAGLISVAAVNAIWAAKQAKIKAEVDQLDMAMKAFKQKYGAYPPSNLVIDTSSNPNPQLKAFVARAFPRYVQGVNGVNLIADLRAYGVDTTNYNPARALVFWLSGFNPDVTQPFAIGGTREAFFDFDKTRFKTGEFFTDANGNGVWDTGETYTDSNGNGAYNLNPQYYVPSGGQNIPYVYFDSRAYRINAGSPTTVAYYAPTASNFAVPYALDVNGNRRLDTVEGFSDVAQSLSTTPATTQPANQTFDATETFTDSGGNSLLDFSSDTWANPDSFQIISAGQDGQFSSPFMVNARVRLYPTGAGYDTEDNDNVTNFSDKASLEDAKP
jgi:prepilin-type N-terminal cleavage/methylation domain-containing protein